MKLCTKNGWSMLFAATLAVALPALAQVLNDTGIDVCRDLTTLQDTKVDATGNCTIAQHGRQDARFGRDAAAAKGAIGKAGGGGKGFDFTKISNAGKPLAAGAKPGDTDSDWACTYDNHTGLMWEVKKMSPNGPRSMEYTYTWYDGINNYNGIPGSRELSVTCETAGHCNTQAFVEDANLTKLCGHNDWRMPTINELSFLADRGRFAPTIDPTFFPYTATELPPASNVTTDPAISAAVYWSATPHAGFLGYAWAVGFMYGSVYHYAFSEAHRVRLVRTGQ
jgi:hypothetical protein